MVSSGPGAQPPNPRQVTDVYFICDVIINFRTAYFDKDGKSTTAVELPLLVFYDNPYRICQIL
jgi:hypothetical protein